MIAQADLDRAVEVARRAMVRHDCEDTVKWLVKRHHMTPAEAHAHVQEGLKDLGGRSGTGVLARIVVEAALHELGLL